MLDEVYEIQKRNIALIYWHSIDPRYENSYSNQFIRGLGALWNTVVLDVGGKKKQKTDGLICARLQ